MTQPTAPPRTGVNPPQRYLALVATLVLLWPLTRRSVDGVGLELSAAIVGAVVATLGVASGSLAARRR